MTMAKTTNKKTVKLGLKTIIIGLVIVAAGIAVFFLKSKIVVAWVNGRPVWHWTYITELERQAGQQTLDSLITQNLILQEAKKQKVSVTNDEIDEDLKKIEASVTAQGQVLEDLLKAQGLSLQDLKNQIKLNKLLDKLVGQDVEVSDEEIQKYISENKDFLPEEQSAEELNSSIKEQLRQQKLNEKLQDWLKSLKDGAKIVSWL
jgi:foldase protein PrsA